MEKTTNSTTSTDQSSGDELTPQELDERFAHSRHCVTKLYEATTEIWKCATDGLHKTCPISINKIYDTIVELWPMWVGYDAPEARLLAQIFRPTPGPDLRWHIHKLKRQIAQTSNAGLAAHTIEEKLARYK